MVDHSFGGDSSVASGRPNGATNENGTRANCDAPSQHSRESVVTWVYQMDPIEYGEPDEDESEADAEGGGLLHSSSFVGIVSRSRVEPLSWLVSSSKCDQHAVLVDHLFETVT